MPCNGSVCDGIIEDSIDSVGRRDARRARGIEKGQGGLSAEDVLGQEPAHVRAAGVAGVRAADDIGPGHAGHAPSIGMASAVSASRPSQMRAMRASASAGTRGGEAHVADQVVGQGLDAAALAIAVALPAAADQHRAIRELLERQAARWRRSARCA